MSEPITKLSEYRTSGKTASAFVAAALGIVLIGLLAYFRRSLPFLEIYPPMGRFSGIWLYSHAFWLVIWLLSYVALMNARAVGNLRTWTYLLIGLVIVSTLLVEGSLKLELLFK